MTTRIMQQVSAAAIAASLLACGSSTPTSTNNTGGGTQVQALASLAFSPANVAVQPGATVTWVFGAVGHTVTFDAQAGVPNDIGSVSSPNANVSVSRTFTTAGIYTYHCSIHPSMTGSVTVGASTVSPPPAPPPPPPAGYSIKP